MESNSYKYYKLNFTGFFDTEEDIFGKKVLTEEYSDNYFNIKELTSDCAKVLNSIGLEIDINKIIEYQVMNTAFAGNLLVVGQDQYIILINQNALSKKDLLTNIVYHELCHLYQCERLFKEKIVVWNYEHDCLTANEKMRALAKTHLENSGHTYYWKIAADAVNARIKPKYLIKAYLAKEEKQELFDEELLEYFNLNFDGFYD